jgi:hypothetical protein
MPPTCGTIPLCCLVHKFVDSVWMISIHEPSLGFLESFFDKAHYRVAFNCPIKLLMTQPRPVVVWGTLSPRGQCCPGSMVDVK